MIKRTIFTHKLPRLPSETIEGLWEVVEGE
jgi:hypothetical protein